MSPPSKHTRSKEDAPESPSASNSLSTTSLPKDTPQWGISLFMMLSNFITSLESKITELTSSLQNSADTATTAQLLAQENKGTIESLTSKLDHLSDAVQFLMAENKKQKEHIIKNELHSRRENLIFRGFSPNPEDTESCEVKVRTIFRAMGIPNLERIQFARCHYLREKKQIIVRFQWSADREVIWMNRYKLRNTQFYVTEDFPAVIESQRKQLYPVFKSVSPRLSKKSDYEREQVGTERTTLLNRNCASGPPTVPPSQVGCEIFGVCFSFWWCNQQSP